LVERLARREIAPDAPISPLELHRLAGDLSSRARLEQFGTPVGRLLIAGKIEASHYAAARAWDRLAARYLAAIRAPAPSPPSTRLEPPGISAGTTPGRMIPGADDIRQAVDRIAQARFSDALRLLNQGGVERTRIVRQVCEGNGCYPVGYQELLLLRAGLSALARHWRLTESR
jgi:hypothetical protein